MRHDRPRRREGTVLRRVDAGTTVISVLEGDLTAQVVDVVVNAANERLAHGGGVAAALSGAGGPAVQAESDGWVREHGPVQQGGAAVTTGGDLPARRIVHVVGPRFRPGQDNEGLLQQAVRAALAAALREGVRTIALPAISAGIFGYPPAEATRVIADEVRRWCTEHRGAFDEVRLVGFDHTAAQRFAAALEDL